MFAGPVHTRLPYSDKVLPEDAEYEAVMITKDALITVAVGHYLSQPLL